MNESNNLIVNTPIRDSFVFYRSFQEAIDELEAADQLTVYRAISSYALYRQDPELVGTTKIVWLLVKPQLDANWRKYEKGRKGGAPIGNSNAGKTTIGENENNLKQPSNNLKQPSNNLKQPNVNVNVNDNVNENDNVFEEYDIPILSDIVTYIAQTGLAVDAESFYDYYTSNGWKLGKNPMADWRAALRNWNRRPDLRPEKERTNLQITISNDL